MKELTWQDIDVLESVQEAVKRSADLTDLLSGEKRVTCSTIKLFIEIINNKIIATLKMGDTYTPLTVEVKEHIKCDFLYRPE